MELTNMISLSIQMKSTQNIPIKSLFNSDWTPIKSLKISQSEGHNIPSTLFDPRCFSRSVSLRATASSLRRRARWRWRRPRIPSAVRSSWRSWAPWPRGERAGEGLGKGWGRGRAGEADDFWVLKHDIAWQIGDLRGLEPQDGVPKQQTCGQNEKKWTFNMFSARNNLHVTVSSGLLPKRWPKWWHSRGNHRLNGLQMPLGCDKNT